MTKRVSVEVNAEDLEPFYCLGSGAPSPWGNYQSADCGCGEDLRPKILEAWDGTSNPFLVKCGCGREYEVVLSFAVELEGRYK